MNWVYEVLGVENSADTRSIKRAYAKQLRLVHPQSDPVGFQRLNEAYKLALESASGLYQSSLAISKLPEHPTVAGFLQERGVEKSSASLESNVLTDGNDVVDELVASYSLDVLYFSSLDESDGQTDSKSIETYIDPHEMARRCISHASISLSPKPFERWLNGQSELWSLMYRRRVSEFVVPVLASDGLSISGECFDVLLAFFNLYDLNANQNIEALESLRTRSNFAWQLQHGNLEGLHSDWIRAGGMERFSVFKSMINYLSTPSGVISGVFLEQSLSLAAMGNLVRWLKSISPTATIKPLVAEKLKFWEAASDESNISVPRAAVLTADAFFAALFLGGVLVCFAKFNMHAPPWVLWIGFGIILLMWSYFLFGVQFFRWQVQSVKSNPQWPIAHFVAIPALLMLALMCFLFDININIQAAIELTVFLLLACRWGARQGKQLLLLTKDIGVFYVFFGMTVFVLPCALMHYMFTYYPLGPIWLLLCGWLLDVFLWKPPFLEGWIGAIQAKLRFNKG